MPPNQPDNPPPPHPTPPVENHGQYDFIMSPGQGKRLMRVASPKSLLFVVGVAAIIIVLFVIIIAVSKGGSPNSANFIKLAQQQQEMVRVANLQDSALTQQDTKNFVINTSLGMASDETTLTTFLSKNGIKIPAKTLAQGQNSTTDTTLQTAVSDSTLDYTLTQILQQDLAAYKATLLQAYRGTPDKSARALLTTLNHHADLLITQSKE